MPRIPVYTKQVNDARLSPIYQQAQLPVRDIQATQIAGMGDALKEVSQNMQKIAVMQAEGDEVKDKSLVRDSLQKAESDAIQLHTQIKGLKGKEAIDAYTRADEGFNKIRESYLNSFGNERQREFFKASFDSKLTAFRSDISGFQASSREAYEKDTLGAENKVAVDAAVALRTPEAVGQSEQTIMANTRYQMKGADPVVREKAVADNIHNLHQSILEAYAAESPAAAKQYLEANKAKFNPQAYPTLKKQLEEKGLLEDSRNEAMRIAGSTNDLATQLAMVDKIKDAKKAEKVRDMLKERNADKEAAKEQGQRAFMEAEVDKVFKDPNAYQVPMAAEAKTQEHLFDLQKKLKAAARGEDVKTNPEVYYKLVQMDYDQFKKINLADPYYIANLSPANLQDFMKKQKDDKDFAKTQTVSSYVAQFVKDQTKDFAEMSAIQAQFENRLNQYPVEERDKVETLNKVRDELMMETKKKEIYGVPIPFTGSVAWKAKMEGKDATPAERPANVPKDAQWVDKKVGDTPLKGWVSTRPDGTKVIYAANGKIYRVKD